MFLIQYIFINLPADAERCSVALKNSLEFSSISSHNYDHHFYLVLHWFSQMILRKICHPQNYKKNIVAYLKLSISVFIIFIPSLSGLSWVEYLFRYIHS